MQKRAQTEPGPRRRKPSSTWNEWPAMELTPPAKPVASALKQAPRKPVPGLPGKGLAPIGADPGLDDAWDLDLMDLDDRDGSRSTPRARDKARDKAPAAARDMRERAAPGKQDGSYQATRGSADSLRDEPFLVEDVKAQGRPEVDSLGEATTTEFRVQQEQEATIGRIRARNVDSEHELEFEALDDAPDVDDWAQGVEFTGIDRVEKLLLAMLERDAPPDESEVSRLKRHVTLLIDRAKAEYILGNLETAVVALDLMFRADPDSVSTQTQLQIHQDTICEIYEGYIGDTDAVPALTMPLHQVSSASMNSRAAFLLTRIDGIMSFDELLDVAGMPRLEALRYLSMLLLRGIVGKT